MADVRALRGVRYDQERVPDLGLVVAPPYDVIPEEELPALWQRSPYNVARLTRPGDDYEGAAELERTWLAEGVLRQDPEPSMYVHEHEFEGGSRRGILAAVRIVPYEAGEVLPHERTHRGPKEDRLALYRATRTSFEPLWMVYQGEGSELPALLGQERGESDLSFDFAGQRHRIWKVGPGEWVDRVSAAFRGRRLLIADGHHRYETALAYAAEAGGPADASSRFALVLLVDLGDPGLCVLPTHRVLRWAPVTVVGGEAKESLAETLAALDGQVAAGHYAKGRFQVLPLEGEQPLVELHRQVIDNQLGKRAAEEVLMYTRDPAEAVRWVDEGRGQAAFFLAPPDLAVVLKLAQAGTTLPQKSTYFDPKPPSGMLLQRLDQATL